MPNLITGGAGFIGSYLVDRLALKDKSTIVIDDLSTGKYINSRSRFIKFDLRRKINLKVPKEAGIFHLAANPSVRTSMVDTAEHFDRDVKATLNVLEMARKYDSSFIIFISTSAVYGEADKIPTSESEMPKPISNYANFKLLCEDMIDFYSRNYGIKAASLRMANVVGKRSDHGIIPDFIKKLSNDAHNLELLGNGTQKKSYIHVTDAVDAILFMSRKATKKHDRINVGSKDCISVLDIAKIIESKLGVNPKHSFHDAGDGRGWPGDVKRMHLDISKIKKLGWSPKMDSRTAISKTVEEILQK